MNQLANIIEGILLLAGNSVAKEDIKEKLGLTDKNINLAIADLKEKYTDCGILLLEVNDKLQFATNQKYADDISAVLNPIKEREFSQSMLEVASIIAYKQPITRLEVETIRGVSSEYAISALVKQKIILPVGRKDAVGKPYLFGTTETFLKKFNLKDITELPNYDELITKLKEYDTAEEQNQVFLSLDELEDEELPEFLYGEEVDVIE